MSAHRTPAERACFDALVEHNTPRTSDDAPYPECLWPIAKAATKAVLAADLAETERLRQISRDHAATRGPRCTHPNSSTNQDGEPVCDVCGWMP